MRQLLLSSELLVGVCVLAVVLFLGLDLRPPPAHRPRRAAHPLRHPGRRAESPVAVRAAARYASGQVEWFPLGGLRVRPAAPVGAHPARASAPRTALDPREKPTALIQEAVGVGCSHELERFDLALAPGPYTALRSWLEASPPGRNVNVA